ncbi:cyclic GMP-AMP synthase-like receptor, partial [Condylostylus longicornis]
IIKKLRDRRNLNNLKSYFIKTILLWEIKRQNIPFYWDKQQNMLSN